MAEIDGSKADVCSGCWLEVGGPFDVFITVEDECVNKDVCSNTVEVVSVVMGVDV